MKKKELLTKLCKDLIKVCHQLRQQNKNGRKSKETVSERTQNATNVFKESCWNLNCQLLVLKQLLYQDLILICLQIFVSILISNLTLIEIPRPYGNYAPFMPSEPGSAMRHIIKPKIREIEY